MSQVTLMLNELHACEEQGADQLLLLVYDELRRLARARLSSERPGQTLSATALVHEAYLRLVEVKQTQSWESRGHFFATAAEAMRRILIERARRKKSLKGGGQLQRVEFSDSTIGLQSSPDDVLALDEALTKLGEEDPIAADIARLRLFAGLSLDETAMALTLARTTAFRHWTYARAFLHVELRRN
jgi:RNA polymerase sigma factor (TIGR02999 family)